MALGGRPVLDWSVEAFTAAGAGRIVVVVPADDVDRAKAAYPSTIVVAGGADRAASVVGGLRALARAADETDVVMVHDAARPLLNSQHINRLLTKLETADAAILALPLADSLKRAHSGMIAEAVPRDYLWRAQLLRHAAKRQVGHPGHRRDQHAAGNFDVTDEQAFRHAASIQDLH